MTAPRRIIVRPCRDRDFRSTPAAPNSFETIVGNTTFLVNPMDHRHILVICRQQAWIIRAYSHAGYIAITTSPQTYTSTQLGKGELHWGSLIISIKLDNGCIVVLCNIIGTNSVFVVSPGSVARRQIQYANTGVQRYFIINEDVNRFAN